MRLLLDTHAFLWWVWDAPELSARARKAIADPESECLLSLASCEFPALRSHFVVGVKAPPDFRRNGATTLSA